MIHGKLVVVTVLCFSLFATAGGEISAPQEYKPMLSVKSNVDRNSGTLVDVILLPSVKYLVENDNYRKMEIMASEMVEAYTNRSIKR